MQFPMQPTILALSVTYILVTASIHLKWLVPMPAAVIFTYYCCILGVITSVLYYLSLYYYFLIGQCTLIGLYIGHWFVPMQTEIDQRIWLASADGELYQQHQPLHMVVKIVFIFCVLVSLASSLKYQLQETAEAVISRRSVAALSPAATGAAATM